MKKVKITTTIIIVLALSVLAGEAIGQPGGRGRSGQGWGEGPERGQRMAGRPQWNADLDSPQPDDSWTPGPYCPWDQGPNQNIRPRQGRGRGGFDQDYQGPRGPYRPSGQGPNQNIRPRQGRDWGGFERDYQEPRGPYRPSDQGPNQNIRPRQGRGPGRYDRDFQGRGPSGYGQGFLGRGQGPRGQGFGRQDMMKQRGPGVNRGGRGPAVQDRDGRGFQNAGPGIQGRGGRDFDRRNKIPQGWGMNNWQGQTGPGGRGGQGPRMRPRQFVPEDLDQTDQPTPPRGRGWTPGYGPRTGQGWEQDWTPDWNLKSQPETAPDTNAPEAPIVEDQPEQPHGE